MLGFKKKRSLRKQINRRMMLNAVLSIFVTVGLMLYFVFGGIDFLAIMWTEETAEEISLELGRELIKSDDVMNSNGDFRRLRKIISKYNFNVEDQISVMMEPDEEDDAEDYEDLYYYNDFLMIEIYIKDQLVYTNIEDISLKDSMVIGESDRASREDHENRRELFLTNQFLAESEIINELGGIVGHVYVTLNPYMILLITASFAMILGVSILVAIVISSIISYFAAKILMAPLNVLNKKLNVLSEDDIEHVQPLEYQTKKPLIEVEGLVVSTNKIVEKMRRYTELLNDQKTELAVQNDELVENGIRLENLNGALKNTNVHLKDILDNVGQGFLKLTDDLRVYPGYSRECDAIFEQVIHNARFAGLLYPDDEEQAEFVEELMASIMNEPLHKIDLYLPLLPDECSVGHKIIQIEYNISNQNDERSIIVVLTDISEKRDLENLMEKERHTLQMIVNYLLHHGLFSDLLSEFEDFLVEGKSQGWSFVGSKEEDRQYVLRQLHTFKGNFGQYDATDMADAIHLVESRVIESREADNLQIDIETLERAYDSLTEVIESYVGKELMSNEEFIVLDKVRIKEVIQQLTMHLSESEVKKLAPKLDGLLHISLKDLLSPYNMYVQKMANRLDKSVEELIIEGEDVYVDEKQFQPLIKSLLHIFKNAVVHGIESPDDRLDSNKDIVGYITCHVSQDMDGISIRIKDDGAGIDDRVQGQIFDDQFSTAEGVTIHAGRGVGLSAVKQEVEHLNGQIQVNSKLGEGTEFIIQIPLESLASRDKMPENLMEAIIRSGSKYFAEMTGESVAKKELVIQKSNEVILHTTTTLTKITGELNVLLLMTIDQGFEKVLVEKMLAAGMFDEEQMASEQEILREISNTLIGNALGNCESYGEDLELGIPISIHHDALEVYLEKNEVLMADLGSDQKSCKLYMLNMEHLKL